MSARNEAIQELNIQYQKLVLLEKQIERLGNFILSLDCGFPTINDEYPNGMSATEAAEEYIKQLRNVPCGSKLKSANL